MKNFQNQEILEEHPWSSSLIQTLTILLTLALVIGLCLTGRSYLLSKGSLFNTVSGESMMPTLTDGQKLYSDRWEGFLRQDIVCLTLPEKGLEFPGTTEGELLVKRIIGLPGEHVRIDSGSRIYIDDEYLYEPYLSEDNRDTTFEDYEDRIMDITLGENEYFVLGDNRGDSLDSRAFGPVQIQEIQSSQTVSISPFLLKTFGMLILICVALPLLFYKLLDDTLKFTACKILKKKQA